MSNAKNAKNEMNHIRKAVGEIYTMLHKQCIKKGLEKLACTVKERQNKAQEVIENPEINEDAMYAFCVTEVINLFCEYVKQNKGEIAKKDKREFSEILDYFRDVEEKILNIVKNADQKKNNESKVEFLKSYFKED